MRKRVSVSAGAIAAVALVGVLALDVNRSEGQAPAPAFRAERLPGTEQPNLNGIWQALNTANWDLEAHAAAPAPFPRQLGAIGATPAGLGVVEGGQIPYQPWALEKRKTNFQNRLKPPVDVETNLAAGDPEAKCYLPGVPRATYMPHPFQIVQTPGQILIAYEFTSATRQIHIGRQPEAPNNMWMGWSIGRWEGDTLVVDVTGQVEQTWFDRAGNFHSDAVHVVERYTPASPYHLTYEAMIEDPKVFTRPWKISMPLYRRIEPHAQLLEFKCVEFAEPFMYGHLVERASR